MLKIIHLRFRSIACQPKVDILADLLVKKKTSTLKMFDHDKWQEFLLGRLVVRRSRQQKAGNAFKDQPGKLLFVSTEDALRSHATQKNEHGQTSRVRDSECCKWPSSRWRKSQDHDCGNWTQVHWTSK